MSDKKAAANGHGSNGQSGNSNLNGMGVKHLPKPLPCWCTWCLIGTTA